LNTMHDDLRHVINEVDDPELGIGIVDLGLIYRAEWTASGIEVEMTTTMASCPYAASLRDQVDAILRARFREASAVQVRLVFDPPWSLDRLSKEARQGLGWEGSSMAATGNFALVCWPGQRKH
jgi:metal-sulfur cluster biosynthetic enzyme